MVFPPVLTITSDRVTPNNGRPGRCSCVMVLLWRCHLSITSSCVVHAAWSKFFICLLIFGFQISSFYSKALRNYWLLADFKKKLVIFLWMVNKSSYICYFLLFRLFQKKMNENPFKKIEVKICSVFLTPFCCGVCQHTMRHLLQV